MISNWAIPEAVQSALSLVAGLATAVVVVLGLKRRDRLVPLYLFVLASFFIRVERNGVWLPLPTLVLLAGLLGRWIWNRLARHRNRADT